MAWNAVWLLLPLCAAAFWLARRQLSRPAEEIIDPDWLVETNASAEAVRCVCVDPSVFQGETIVSVRVWAPLEETDAQHFRQQTGSLMLSAAIGVLSKELPPTAPPPDEWLKALHISSANFSRQYPTIDSIRLNGHEGVIVLDGLQQRAYFTGGRELAAGCSRVLNRQIGLRDREKLVSLPDEALCFATCEIKGGQPGALTYVGAVCPSEAVQTDHEAMLSMQELHAQGIETCLSASPDAAGLSDLRLPVLDADHLPGNALRVIRKETAQTHDYSRPALAWLKRQAMRKSREARGLSLCLLLCACMLFSGADALTALAAGGALLLCLRFLPDTLHLPASFTRKQCLLGLLSSAAVPFLLRLALQLALPAQAMPAGSGVLLGWSLIALLSFFAPTGAQRIRWLVFAPLLAPSAAWLCIDPIAFLFGCAAGALCGLASVWLLRKE